MTRVAGTLIEQGEADPDRLTLAVAKAVYRLHPITGKEFQWPPADGDGGAQLIYDRIRLRVATLRASYEEQTADDAIGAGEKEPPEKAEEGDAASDGDGDGAPATDVEQAPRGIAGALVREVLTETRSAPRPALTMRHRRGSRRKDPAWKAYYPADNMPIDGVFHTADEGERVEDLARSAIWNRVFALCEEKGVREAAARAERVASDEKCRADYIALIVSSPDNELATRWNEKYNVPGARDDLLVAGQVLWLPRVSPTHLMEGVVTTTGVTWSDGSSGIQAPPEALQRPREVN